MNKMLKQLDPSENAEMVLSLIDVDCKIYQLPETDMYLLISENLIIYAEKSGQQYVPSSKVKINKFDFYKQLKKMSAVDLDDKFYYVHQLSETSFELRLLYRRGTSFISCKTWFNNFKPLNKNSVFIIDTHVKDKEVNIAPSEIIHIIHEPYQMNGFKVFFKDGRPSETVTELLVSL